MGVAGSPPGPRLCCSQLLCLSPGVLQLLQSRTSRKFLACRLTPDMETKMLFMTSRVIPSCASAGQEDARPCPVRGAPVPFPRRHWAWGGRAEHQSGQRTELYWCKYLLLLASAGDRKRRSCPAGADVAGLATPLVFVKWHKRALQGHVAPGWPIAKASASSARRAGSSWVPEGSGAAQRRPRGSRYPCAGSARCPPASCSRGAACAVRAGVRARLLGWRCESAARWPVGFLRLSEGAAGAGLPGV